MKLLEVARRGGGYCATLQLTTNELTSIIALYEAVAQDWVPGYAQEKRTKARLRDIFEIVERVIETRIEYRDNPTEGTAYYENKEGEMDAVQRFLEEGARKRIQRFDR